MGWGINFNSDIYLSRISADNQFQLEDLIADKEKYISDLEKELLMYVSANPAELVPKDWEEEKIGFLKNQVETLLEEIKESEVTLFKLYLYKDSNPFLKQEEDVKETEE